MAWFNEPDDAAEAPAPLTLQRLADWFDSNELAYDLDEPKQMLLTGFDDTFIMVGCAEGRFSFHMFSPGTLLPAEHFDEALIWANSWNSETFVPTAVPEITDENEVRMSVDSAFILGDAGVTDEQLNEFLLVSIRSSIEAISEYANAMGMEWSFE